MPPLIAFSIDIGCPIEDLRTIFHTKHQTSSQWEKIEVPNAYNASATVAGPSQMVWNQTKNEIFGWNKVKAHLESRKPTTNSLMHLAFGLKSNIWWLVKEKLEIKK
jgi:hypothetical protein